MWPLVLIIGIGPLTRFLITSMTLPACFFTVDRTERRSQKSLAPWAERKPPEFFCLSLSIRMSRSAWLLSKGMLKSVMNDRICAAVASSLSSRQRALPLAGLPRLPLGGVVGGGISERPALMILR